MAPDVATEAVPRDRGGVAVSLRATRTSGAAIVIFRAPDGTFIPPGASGVVVGTGRSFIVGYDGRAWIEDLAAQNQVKIEMSGEACTGSFAFKQEPGSHAVIDGAICK
jgi:outer membrane usher protein